MTIKKYRANIEATIAAWLTGYQQEAPSPESKVLIARMRSLVLRGGKRARPLLLYVTYRGYGGQEFDLLTDLGAVLELHHQFLLMHDDVIDNDTVRYDGPNITGYYQRDHGINAQAAEAMGLLAGDLLLSFAQSALLKSTHLTPAVKVALLDVLHDTNIGVGYGQLLDSFNLDTEPAHFDIDKLLNIHTLKSALYSTRLPMQTAALLLGLTENEREKIESFTVPFGILFQLVDDYSDYFINASAFNNHPKYRDYRQGKITYPIYQGLKLSNKADRKFLNEHLGDKTFAEHEMQRVIAILENNGAKKASQLFIEPYFIEAVRTLENLALDSRYRQVLADTIASYRV